VIDVDTNPEPEGYALVFLRVASHRNWLSVCFLSGNKNSRFRLSLFDLFGKLIKPVNSQSANIAILEN